MTLLYESHRCMNERRTKLRNKQKTRFQKGSFPYSGTEHTPLHHVSLRELEETHRSPTACALRERDFLIKALNKQISQVNQMNQGTDQATGGGSLEAAKRALEEIFCSLSALRETQVTQEEFNMRLITAYV